MSRTMQVIAVALTSLAVAAPVATAVPVEQPLEHGSAAVAPAQDLRNPDQRAPLTAAAPPSTSPAVHAPAPAVQADDGGTSPLAYVLPSLALVLIAVAAAAYARTAAHPRRSHAGV
jgi:hypothetical protein